MILLPGEEIISASNIKLLTLTNQRVFYKDDSTPNVVRKTIMLEHITSCETGRTKKNIKHLIASIVSLIGTMVIEVYRSPLALVSLVLCRGFWHLYSKSGNSFILIGSPTTEIKINTTETNNKTLSEFLNELNYQKSLRIQLLA